MKFFNTSLLVVSLAVLGSAAFGAPALPKLNDLNIINVALTFKSQGGFSHNGTLQIYAKPVSQKVSTKDLLSQLALDEFALTNYPATSFPPGAKLAINGTNGAVVVVNGNNELLVDVSAIITLAAGTNDIVSGSVSDVTGLARPNTTELIYVSLNFDDTFVPRNGSVNFFPGGGSLKFFVTGLDTVKTTDSTPGAAGNYHETTSDSVQNAAGEGQSDGTQFVATGSIQGNRSANLTTVTPTN